VNWLHQFWHRFNKDYLTLQV